AAHHRTSAGRWTTPARRRSCAAGTVVYAASARVCAGARADRRNRAGAGNRRARAGLGGVLMRYLIISDIHANLEALEATLSAAGEFDGVLVLGDLVGYGADPNAVIDRIRGLAGATIIRGNHDKVGAGI